MSLWELTGLAVLVATPADADGPDLLERPSCVGRRVADRVLLVVVRAPA